MSQAQGSERGGGHRRLGRRAPRVAGAVPTRPFCRTETWGCSAFPTSLLGARPTLCWGEGVAGFESSPLGSVPAWLRFAQSGDERTRARLATVEPRGWTLAGSRQSPPPRPQDDRLPGAAMSRGHRHMWEETPLRELHRGQRPCGQAPLRCCLTEPGPEGIPGALTTPAALQTGPEATSAQTDTRPDTTHFPEWLLPPPPGGQLSRRFRTFPLSCTP